MIRVFAMLGVWTAVLAAGAVAQAAAAGFNPFAAAVIDTSLNAPNPPQYLPAPGQFVNNAEYNNVAKALGPPAGGGTFTPDSSSVVSLGGFGGQLVLAFDHDVRDGPANPFGLDAIVFSNAVWAEGSSQLHFAEFATIEVMPELSGDSVPGNDPGERWYLIPGSVLAGPSAYRASTWTRGSVLNYPTFTGWPDSYQTGAHELSPTYQTINGKAGIVVNPNYGGDPGDDNQEGYWGYGEYTPTLLLGDRDGDNSAAGLGDCPTMPPGLFYTVPDDPRAVGITRSAGGGDAFDIAWAVDPATWAPAGLTSFRYIRLTTAVDRFIVPVGEISAEIDAVADVRPVGDLNGDDVVDLDDYGLLLAAWGSAWGQAGFDPAADLLVDNLINGGDYDRFVWGWSAYYGQDGDGPSAPPRPVPEPSSLVLLAAGAGALFAPPRRHGRGRA